MLGASIVGIVQLGQACNTQAVQDLSLHRRVSALKACICLVSSTAKVRRDASSSTQSLITSNTAALGAISLGQLLVLLEVSEL